MFRQISELREVISLQSPVSQAATSSGYKPKEWTTYATGVRAKIEITGTSEGTVAGGREARITGTITIRYRSDGKPVSTDKVLWGDRVLNIDGVRDPNGRIRQTELDFTQVV